MTLVSQPAPDFTASAILGNGEIIKEFNFKQNINGNQVVLFFWPMDFTFVCPSELISFNRRYDDFQNRNVQLIGVSLDSEFTHNAWRNTPIERGGIGQVKYTMVADIKREIQQIYGVNHPSMGVALRASFFIDKYGIIRHQTVNDLPIGRNIDELLRIIDAWNFHEKYGLVCPSQWTKGKEGITPTQDGISQFLTKNISSL